MNDGSDINEVPVWYAMRVSYQRELRVKDELDAQGIRSFVPMQYKRVVEGDRMVKRLVPSVHNLIFVWLAPKAMREYKMTTAQPVRYIIDHTTGRPMIVPERQMESFIKVAGTYDEGLIYLNPNPGDFIAGDRVRIMGGPFEGAEGVFVRVKGDRRVVVNIEGVVAVATTFIHPSFLERIDNTSTQ